MLFFSSSLVSIFFLFIYNTHYILLYCSTARVVCATFVYINRIDFSCDSASAYGSHCCVFVVVVCIRIFYIIFSLLCLPCNTAFTWYFWCLSPEQLSKAMDCQHLLHANTHTQAARAHILCTSDDDISPCLLSTYIRIRLHEHSAAAVPMLWNAKIRSDNVFFTITIVIGFFLSVRQEKIFNDSKNSRPMALNKRCERLPHRWD